MKKMMVASLLVFGLLIGFGAVNLTGASVAAAPPAKNFVATLSGDQEVPPVDSNGRGVAKFQLDEDAGELGYKLIVANIEDVTQAHIHCGPEGANGPVVAFLFGFVAGGVDVNGVLAEGTITNADVIARPDSAACPGGVESLDDIIAKMRNGGAYVNVHTVAHPPGEIRGQIISAGPE